MKQCWSAQAPCQDEFEFPERAVHSILKRVPAVGGSDNAPPNSLPPSDESTTIVRGADVVCRERLGGLLKHYERRAA